LGRGQNFKVKIVSGFLTPHADHRRAQRLYNGGVGCQYPWGKCPVAVQSSVYDGDGNRVQATMGGVTTVYLGNYYEWNGSAGVKYYYAEGGRVAMRDASSTLYFLLGDHLASTAKTVTSSGTLYAELR